MLEIVVPSSEVFDENTQCFLETNETTLQLEHSLLSISKWESRWHKPFIVKDKKTKRTSEEMLDYIRCMTLNRHVDPTVYLVLTPMNIKSIEQYMNDPMTATTVADIPGAPMRNEIITSELIYYWMIALSIPVEFEKWHINRLIMLIKVCSAKNNPKKMSSQAIMSQNRQLNEARKKALGTRG